MTFPIPPIKDPIQQIEPKHIDRFGGIESVIIFTFVIYTIFYRKPYFATYTIFYVIILAFNYTKTTSQELIAYSLIYLFLTATTTIHYSLFIVGLFIAMIHVYNNNLTKVPIPQVLGVIYAVAVYYCTKYYLSIQLQIQEEPYINFI
jgi:hypothetical protein